MVTDDNTKYQATNFVIRGYTRYNRVYIKGFDVLGSI